MGNMEGQVIDEGGWKESRCRCKCQYVCVCIV